MFEKEENTVQIKSNISPIHVSYNPWYGLKYSFRVAKLDSVKGTQEKNACWKRAKSKESEHCNATRL